MSTATQISVPPWGIEADHPTNSDLLLQCIPGQRLRSALDGSKASLNVKTGDYTIPLDQSRSLASCPKLPGMQVHINPEKLTYSVIDPLRDNEPLLSRLERFLSQSAGRPVNSKLNGVEKLEGTLDPHQMKSLCREMMRLVNCGHAKLVRGALPEIDDIDELPGHYLLNPGSIVFNQQPRYEKDYADWIANLSRG